MGLIPGAESVLGYTTAAGRVYTVPGYPDSPVWPGAGAAFGGNVWHSASTNVNVYAAGTGAGTGGGFVSATTQANRHILFRGDDDRWLQVGPLNLSAAEKLVFNVIKGNGSNGGETPDGGMDLTLYYKTSTEASATATLVQQIAPTTVSALSLIHI